MNITVQNKPKNVPRRQFLKTLAQGGTLASSGLPFFSLPAVATHAAAENTRPRIAVIYTELRFRSHAYNFLDNFLEPYMFSGKLVDPGCDVVSLYADQFPERDLSRDFARQFHIPLFPSIEQALCLGGEKLAVDGVLLIGEHGDYPLNERGQRMYPRKEFFDAIVAVMKKSDRFVPVFNDKHLSYRWDWAQEMYETAQTLGFPLMAGSSVPLGQRIPPIEVAKGTELEEAVSIHGGGMESYDFHALEVLQSFVEFRKGGESGVSRVELLTGEALRKAEDEGRWSTELAEAALTAEVNASTARQLRPDSGQRGNPRSRNVVPDGSPKPKLATKPSHAILLTYKDGFRAAILKIGGSANRWNFACKVRGEEKPRATAIYNGPWGNRCLFKALSHAIQYMFTTGKQPYPIERNLLVSGILEEAMKSHAANGKPIETPGLEFGYQPINFDALRENGASWKLLTADIPQPISLSTSDASLIEGRK